MPREHTCTICGTTGPWTEAWVWYGSYRQIDDGEPVVKLCSPPCRAEFSKRRKLATLAKAAARREARLAMMGMR